MCGSFAVTFPEISLQRYRQIYYLDHISEWEFNSLILSTFYADIQRFSVPQNPRKPRETKNSQSSQTQSESPGSSQKPKNRNGTNAKSPAVSPSRPTVGLQILSSKIYERFTFVRITTAATTCCYTSPMAASAVVLLQSHHTL